MIIIVLTAFASAIFAALGFVLFTASFRNGDFEQTERLSILPFRKD